MVAISLYKGNLHKVPDVPRRWTPPTPKISPKDFRILVSRRARTLSRLRSSVTTASNPNPDPDPDSDLKSNNAIPCSVPSVNKNDIETKIPAVDKNDTETELSPTEDAKENKDEGGVEEINDSVQKLDEKVGASAGEKNAENVNSVERKEPPSDLEVVERNNAEGATGDKQKRIKEITEKLEVLNERKHSLVQVLKQILNAEEQLKRQNNTQGTSGRPPLPLQVDSTTDSVSVTRVHTPRIGSDGNPCSETDGGGADDGSNHNLHSRQLPRMSSTSPSSGSQQRKSAPNLVPHNYKTTLAVAGSPSRFGPSGPQGHPSVISISGTGSYIASSPSPAASGGTSVFRDVRLPSPFN